jgi:predicted dinucleotide-binding enzyme
VRTTLPTLALVLTLGLTTLGVSVVRAADADAPARDDPKALAIAERLVREIGFEPVMIGSLARTRLFDLGQPLATGQLTAGQMRSKLGQL